MTGRQLYNFLLTSVKDGLEIYVSGFYSNCSDAVVGVDTEGSDGIEIVCAEIGSGKQTSRPMKAGRLFKRLHEACDKSAMDLDVKVCRRASSWRTERRWLNSAAEVPCYKGKALCLTTKAR